MERLIEAGLSYLEAWDATPNEAVVVLAAHARRRRHELESAALSGYLAASLARAKRIPPFEKILEKPREPRIVKVSREERIREFESLKAELG